MMRLLTGLTEVASRAPCNMFAYNYDSSSTNFFFGRNMFGRVSTWLGDRLGILGSVGLQQGPLLIVRK